MAYENLSTQLTNPHGSDAFVKQFRNAVREVKIEAADSLIAPSCPRSTAAVAQMKRTAAP